MVVPEIGAKLSYPAIDRTRAFASAQGRFNDTLR